MARCLSHSGAVISRVLYCFSHSVRKVWEGASEGLFIVYGMKMGECRRMNRGNMVVVPGKKLKCCTCPGTRL